MQPGEDAGSAAAQKSADSLQSGRRRRLSLCGCATSNRNLDQAMQTPRPAQPASAGPAAPYSLGYPDVLEVTIRGQADPPSPSLVGVDGRIDLGPRGRAYVEGQTLDQAVRTVADVARVAHGTGIPASPGI